jgi:hypothetical protein
METVREINKAENCLQQVIAVRPAPYDVQKQVEFCGSEACKLGCQLSSPPVSI